MNSLKLSSPLKVLLSVLIGTLFLVWMLWNVDFAVMGQTILNAHYVYLLPILLILFLSHWLRAVRWQILLKPVKNIPVNVLFNALIIGYMVNTFTPAHLGEFVRAFILGKREHLPASLIFSTVVVERIVDLLSFLMLMALAMVLYPFPQWVKNGGYVIFTGTILFIFFLIFFKLNFRFSFQLMAILLKPFPRSINIRINEILQSFAGGLNRLKSGLHYFLLIFLSILIWFGYGIIFYIAFDMFDLKMYELNLLAALVLLVITTVGVIVPNAPGYVGTYHKLCQIGLGFFGVPASQGASFAVTMHAINFFPVLILGIIFAARTGLTFSSLSANDSIRPSDN